MTRRSLCWDKYKSEVINLDSSDDDSDCVITKSNVRKSSNSSEINLTKGRKTNKFRIDSDSSSDDCVVYSSGDEYQTPLTPRKIDALKLPTFSFETPDKKTQTKNAKLLRDISNICNSASKGDRKPLDEGKRARPVNGKKVGRNKVSEEEKRVINDKLFDSIVGLDKSYPSDDETSKTTPEKSNDTYSTILSRFNDVNKTKCSLPDFGTRSKDPEPAATSNDVFKRPSIFQKQKEIGNKVKRPGDSVIVLRRTDDSDSSATEPHTDSARTFNDDRLSNNYELSNKLLRKSLENKLSPKETSDSDDCVVTNELRPPPKRKGKTSPYSLTNLKSALEAIESNYSSSRKPLSFLKSLSDDVDEAKCHLTAKMYKEKFGKKKEELAAVLYKIFNEGVFESKLPDDMNLDWSGRMTSSAGITHLSRKISNGEWVFLARITLSKPILTTAGRLRDTMIHEMCHAAVWLLDHKKDGHGPFWKNWTRKARQAFPDLLPINTCHSYSRQWKFYWACVSCGYTIGRMTKSFDTQRFSCGRCHGKFELKQDDDTKKRKANGFALFVKDNYASARADGMSHKDIMKALSEKYQILKPNKEIGNVEVEDLDVIEL